MKTILSSTELSLVSGGNQEEVMPLQNTDLTPAGMKTFILFLDNDPEESMKVLFSDIENQTCSTDDE